MAIGVKVMQRPQREVSYVRATLKGLSLTFKHMFEKKVTMQYPEEKSTDVEHGMGPWSVSPRWRGTHRMLTDEQGHRYPLIYEIDEFRCVFCGYCQEVCPEEAIHVGVHYENAEYSRGRFVYDLERLSSQTHPVSTLWDPADPLGE
jgi:NADH-quinone oxidoreductase subunit I